METIKAREFAVESKNYHIKAMLVGPSGSGKTQSSITLPRSEGKPLLLIDYDGRWQTVAGTDTEVVSLYDADPKSAKAWMAAEKLRKELWSLVRQNKFPYSGVIEDGATLMSRYAMNWSLLLDNKRGLGGAPAKQHYLPQMKAFSDHVLSMKSLPCHYVLTGHIELVEDEETGSFQLLPRVIGRGTRSEIAGWFNETYLCSRARDKEGDLVYYWITAGAGRENFFKSSLNTLGRYWKDPVVLDFSKPPVGFERLLSLRFKGEKEEKGD